MDILKFTSEELIELITDKDLRLCIVANVETKDKGWKYKIVATTEEILKRDLELYELTLLSRKYQLLTDDEIDFINKKGYL